MRQKADTQILVRLSRDLREWIREFAQRNNATMSEVIRDAIETKRRLDQQNRIEQSRKGSEWAKPQGH